MPPVKGPTEKVNFLLRPIGFSPPQGKEPTFEDVRKWKEGNPHIILQQSYLTVGGAIAAVVGTVLGIIGLKKDSKLGKWFGGFMTLTGLITTGIGKWLDAEPGLAKNDETDKYKSSEGSRKAFFVDYIARKAESLCGTGPKIASKQLPDVMAGGQAAQFIEFFNNTPEQFLDKPEKSEVAKWTAEIMEYKNLTKDNFEKCQDREKEVIHGAIICSAIADNRDLHEKLFAYIKDENLHPVVRFATLSALMIRFGLIQKDPRIISTFIELTKKGSQKDIRIQAIKALKELNCKDAVSELINLVSDQDPGECEVRFGAILALARIGEKDAVEPLIKLMDDPDLDIQVEAIHALSWFISRQTNDPKITRALAKGNSSHEVKVVAAARVVLEENKEVTVRHLIQVIDQYHNRKEVIKQENQPTNSRTFFSLRNSLEQEVEEKESIRNEMFALETLLSEDEIKKYYLSLVNRYHNKEIQIAPDDSIIWKLKRLLGEEEAKIVLKELY